MLVAICMSSERNRWSLFAFAVLADFNTWRFLSPPCKQRSWRLFLDGFLRACDETLADNKTSISIRISLHPTLMTENQWRTRGVTFCWLACLIASNEALATSTFSAGIPRIHATGENTCIVRLILGIAENTSLHPEGPFLVASFTVFSLGRLEGPKVFKHQYRCLMLLSKLDHTSTHQMGSLLISMAYLVPEMSIVSFILCDDASLTSVACNPSELFLPKAGYPSPTRNTFGGEDRTFNSLDRTHG